ncbi:hypothetical protein Vadar_000991 [Vaccinium darrowii]|uniref:Uncharacterized protein n=1 Tax=Vaccinium darrowii TaxID=229202 RepID=A0ACB7YKF0_9ERIC|nr:hypothetical protein Vadar_000991 [Vaccinium darrowii]
MSDSPTGIPIKDGNKRCKVVLTSRNRDVWKNMDVHEDFHVKFLTEEEAWTLFKKKVGKHVDSHDEPRHDIAWAICKECQGLPVAINAIGATLKEDEKSFLVKHGFKDWPEKAAYEHCSVISLRPDDVRKFPDKLVCPELHTLRLDCAINGSLLQVPDEFFIGTGNLMVLDLKEVIMWPLLPASLAKLAKLQMLCLNQCHLGDIGILKDLKDHLEILNLRGSNIEVLPPEVGELTRLRLLDMSDCLQLRMIPKGVISKLFCLEELHMPMNFGKWEGTTDERKISNASLDELMSLTRLTTLNIWIPNAALLPKDLSFENLVRFEIIISKRFEYDPVRHFRHRVYTKPLTGTLILENFHVANDLEFLLGKPKPKWSIRRNSSYPYLTDLSVRDCGMKYLFSPSCARELVGLQRLTIKHCGIMEGVIETEKDKDEDIPIIFSGLKLLNLENLPNLISFYPEKGKTATSSGSSSGHAQTVLFNDKVKFPQLENLELEGLQNMDNIWGSEYPTSSLSELKCLQAKRCVKLKNIFCPSMARVLVNLQELIINDCSKMEAVVNGEKEIEDGQGRKIYETLFPNFTKLELRRLPKLGRFCDFTHPFKLPLLSQMVIEDCPRLNSFSSGSVSTPNLLSRDLSCDFVDDDTTVTEEEEPSKMV